MIPRKDHLSKGEAKALLDSNRDDIAAHTGQMINIIRKGYESWIETLIRDRLPIAKFYRNQDEAVKIKRDIRDMQHMLDIADAMKTVDEHYDTESFVEYLRSKRSEAAKEEATS